MKTFNEKLANWIHAVPATEAGINKRQEPTVYEQDFVQHLIKAFAAGVTELADLVQTLNQQGFRCESGELWTSESFSEEMQRLGY